MKVEIEVSILVREGMVPFVGVVISKRHKPKTLLYMLIEVEIGNKVSLLSGVKVA